MTTPYQHLPGLISKHVLNIYQVTENRISGLWLTVVPEKLAWEFSSSASTRMPDRENREGSAHLLPECPTV